MWGEEKRDGRVVRGWMALVYFLPWALGGDFTLLESQAWGCVRTLIDVEMGEGEEGTYQAFQ
jgi:hypothetical protein